jgi:hypothetical protein
MEVVQGRSCGIQAHCNLVATPSKLFRDAAQEEAVREEDRAESKVVGGFRYLACVGMKEGLSTGEEYGIDAQLLGLMKRLHGKGQGQIPSPAFPLSQCLVVAISTAQVATSSEMEVEGAGLRFGWANRWGGTALFWFFHPLFLQGLKEAPHF